VVGYVGFPFYQVGCGGNRCLGGRSIGGGGACVSIK
jgi:hypothetical protein